MQLKFSLINESAAREIVTWRYESPYDIYNLQESADVIQYALDPHWNYHILRDQNDQLIGFCTFGGDGQVPGGDYTAKALDIGMGIHPNFTGQGWGSDIVQTVLAFAKEKYAPTTFRVTIAAFNQRAQRVWQKNGFHPIQTFTNQTTQRDFIVLVKAAE